jgi:DNA-binding PadR family transcriptional regulator
MPARMAARPVGERTDVQTKVDLQEEAERLAGGGVSEETPVAKETELLAGTLLRAVNRVQSKGSTVRLVVPRAPEVTYEVGMELPEDELLEVEEYLQNNGYIVPVDIGLTRGTYTITPAGLEWLDMDVSEPLEALDQEATGPLEWAEPPLATNDTREDIENRPQGRIPRRLQREMNKARKQLEERSDERDWWQRMFRGFKT